MMLLELTNDEAAVLERLFNQVSGIDAMRAILPIHDKMIAATKMGDPRSEGVIPVAEIRKRKNGESPRPT